MKRNYEQFLIERGEYDDRNNDPIIDDNFEWVLNYPESNNDNFKKSKMGLNTNQNYIDIPEFRKIPLRSDGFLNKEDEENPEIRKTLTERDFLPNGPHYIENLISRDKIFQDHKDIQFLTRVAGKMGMTTVDSIFTSESIQFTEQKIKQVESIMRKEEQRRLLNWTEKKKQIDTLDSFIEKQTKERDEIRNNQVSSESITKLNKFNDEYEDIILQINSINVFTQAVDILNTIDLIEDDKIEILTTNILWELSPSIEDIKNEFSSFIKQKNENDKPREILRIASFLYIISFILEKVYIQQKDIKRIRKQELEEQEQKLEEVIIYEDYYENYYFPFLKDNNLIDLNSLTKIIFNNIIKNNKNDETRSSVIDLLKKYIQLSDLNYFSKNSKEYFIEILDLSIDPNNDKKAIKIILPTKEALKFYDEYNEILTKYQRISFFDYTFSYLFYKLLSDDNSAIIFDTFTKSLIWNGGEFINNCNIYSKYLNKNSNEENSGYGIKSDTLGSLETQKRKLLKDSNLIITVLKEINESRQNVLFNKEIKEILKDERKTDFDLIKLRIKSINDLLNMIANESLRLYIKEEVKKQLITIEITKKQDMDFYLLKQNSNEFYILRFIRIYERFLEEKIENLTTEIGKFKETKEKAMNEFNDIVGGLPNDLLIKKLKEPYVPSINWEMLPQISGYIKINPVVSAGIASAYRVVNTYCPNLKGVPIEELQNTIDNNALSDLFANVVITEIATNNPLFFKTWIKNDYVPILQVRRKSTKEQLLKFRYNVQLNPYGKSSYKFYVD